MARDNSNKETAFDWTGDREWGTVCSNEQKWITKIRKLKEENPDEVEIVEEPENNYGVIIAHVPKSYFKLNNSKRKAMTEEQKKVAGERMRKMWKDKKQKEDEDEDNDE